MDEHVCIIAQRERARPRLTAKRKKRTGERNRKRNTKGGWEAWTGEQQPIWLKEHAPDERPRNMISDSIVLTRGPFSGLPLGTAPSASPIGQHPLQPPLACRRDVRDNLSHCQPITTRPHLLLRNRRPTYPLPPLVMLCVARTRRARRAVSSEHCAHESWRGPRGRLR